MQVNSVKQHRFALARLLGHPFPSEAKELELILFYFVRNYLMELSNSAAKSACSASICSCRLTRHPRLVALVLIGKTG